MLHKVYMAFAFLFFLLITSCGIMLPNTGNTEVWNKSKEAITVTVNSTDEMEVPVQTADTTSNESSKPHVHNFSVHWYGTATKNVKVKFKGKLIDETITIKSLANYETREVYLIETIKYTMADGETLVTKSVKVITK